MCISQDSETAFALVHRSCRTHLLTSSTIESGCDLDGWVVDRSLLSNRGAWHYGPWSGPTTLENCQLLLEMEVIRIVLRVCKQTHVGCDCCCSDLFCVLRKSSAVSQFFRVKLIWFFSTKKKRRKLASKGKVKCGRRARPNGLASRVKHHLVKEKKGNRLCKHRIQHLFLLQERNNRGTKTAKQTEEGGNEEMA